MDGDYDDAGCSETDDDGKYRDFKVGETGRSILLALVAFSLLLRLINVSFVLRYLVWGINKNMVEPERRFAVRLLAFASLASAALALPAAYYTSFGFTLQAGLLTAFQSVFFAVWLIARDRSLQSNFFRTDPRFLFVTGALAAARFTLLLVACGSRRVHRPIGKFEEFDVSTVVGMAYCIIMSYQFLKPLRGNTRQFESHVIREVVLRTGIGCTVLVLSLCVFLTAEHMWIQYYVNDCGERRKGPTSKFLQELVLCTFVLPELFHTNISHRDDRILLWALKWVFSTQYSLRAFVSSDKEEQREIRRISVMTAEKPLVQLGERESGTSSGGQKKNSSILEASLGDASFA